MLLNDFPFSEVAGWLASGQVVPLLGAGASRVGSSGPNKLPDGPGLATELIGRMRPAYPGQPSDGLARVAEYFEQTVFDRSALFDYLHDRFYQQQVNAPLSRVAELLANMPNPDLKSRFIVTTNYDSLIEQAFHRAQRSLCVITQNMRDPEHGASRVTLRLPDGQLDQDDSLMFQWNDDTRFAPGTTYLFKMHGSADRKVGEQLDDLIITESDYVDFLVNAGGPVSPLFPPVSLLAAFSRRRFLFLGYSLADWNFRAFLRLLALRNAVSKRGQLRHWAIQLHPDELDVQLWGKRNVNIYDADLLQFCDELQAAFAPGNTP
jgi:hypothetical protein